MNKKTIIQVVVIVGALAASGIVLYNGFAGGGTPSLTGPGSASSTPGSGNILPYGTTFDFKKLDDMKEQDFQFGVVPYPTVNPPVEVGKDSVSDLVKPIQIVK